MFKCRDCNGVVEYVIRRRWRSREYGDEIVEYCPLCGGENCLEEIDEEELWTEDEE